MTEKKNGLKAKAMHELKEMLGVFLYLALFFCTFTAYRQLVMKEVGVSYFQYGSALIKALIMAKVILLGQLVGFTRAFDDRPLIVPTLYKVVLFSLFYMAFDVLEHVIGGVLHKKDLMDVFQEMIGAGRDEMLARTLVMLFAFLPFFAFTETDRVLSEGSLLKLFFQRRTKATPAR